MHTGRPNSLSLQMNVSAPDHHMFPNASNFVIKDSIFIHGGFPSGEDPSSTPKHDNGVSESEGQIHFVAKKEYTHEMLIKLKHPRSKVRWLPFVPILFF
jgi:hypothetical protein